MANNASYGMHSGFVYEGGSLSGTKCHRVDARRVSYNTRVDEIYPVLCPNRGRNTVYMAFSHTQVDDIVIF